MKYLVEVEIKGPLEARFRAADTVGGCLMVEQRVRDGFLAPYVDDLERWAHYNEVFLTVRAMEHVTVPTGRVP